MSAAQTAQQPTLFTVLVGDAEPDAAKNAANAAVIIPSSTPSAPHVYSHAQLFRQVNETAAQILPYVNKGDLVSLAFLNDIELVIAFLAVTRIGCVSAPLNAAYTEEEFTFYMEGKTQTPVLIL